MSREIPLPNAWLQQVGFKLGNPFSTRQAAKEPESALVRYFVPHPSFDDILGSAALPRSSFLVARRGCGKTTSQRVIYWHCRSGRMDRPVLAIPYTEFSAALRHVDENGRVPIEHHIEAILRQGLPLLMDVLAEQPEKSDAFIGGLLEELAGYLGHYTNLLTNQGLDKWLQQKGWLSQQVNAKMLRRGEGVGERPLLPFLAELLTLNDLEWNAESLAPTELLAGFVGLAQLADFQALYILIDRVDEREPMASDPEQAANLLESLVTNLPVMELENTAFKLFITPEVMAALQQHSGLRLDRLLARDISWTEQDLQYLLDRRVEVFTEGALPSLDAVSESGNLVAQMATKAQGSPRTMLRLAEWLLYWHHVRIGDGQALLLTKADLDKAIQSLDQEQQSSIEVGSSLPKGLWLDEKRQVWREGKCLGHLSPLLHALFEYLYEHRNQVCTMVAISDAVYGNDLTSDETIRKLAVRLRKEIEPEPRHPRYIIKVPGGYVLEEA